MEFTISDPSALRVLSKTVLVASKLSEHVQFTPHAPALHFRLLTPTHSTYAVFRFNKSFFSTLVLPPPSTSYKVSSKLLPPLLRSPQTIASIRLATHRNNRLCLTVVTQTALTKRFLLPLQEGRISSVRTTPLRNVLQTSAAFLSDLLANFHTKLDEITLIPSQQSLTLVSFVDDTANPSNAFLRTEITVDARQFDSHVFTTGSPGNLTFMCRPLRSVVEYCDSLDVVIRISYDRPASPLQLDMALPAPSGDLYFDALFVFASRVPPQSGHPQQPTATANAFEQQLQQQQQQQLQQEQQQQLQQRQQQPVPVDAMVRPLQMQTETDNQQFPFNPAAVTPLRTVRRHGQKPLIPHPSQQVDPQDAKESESQPTQPPSQEHPPPPPEHPPRSQEHSPSQKHSPPSQDHPPPSEEYLPPVPQEYRPPPPPLPDSQYESSLPPPGSDHMTPIPESDPPLSRHSPIPDSDSTIKPPSYEGVFRRRVDNDDDDDDDEEDDDDDFVEGTPPPETQN